MQFEITIEGPFKAISKLKSNLDPFSPVMKRVPMCNHENPEKGRLIIIEPGEDRLDHSLLVISRIVKETERVLSLESGFDFRVRNLAYSEPSAGSNQFAEPFNPIPSIVIKPWNPDLSKTIDPHTIILDLHHAFGTGKHPTTILCLNIMEIMASDKTRSINLQGSSVLDFGCGTGLLAIAAIKMGAKSAVGVEIDPSSVRAARRNVVLNHLNQKVTIRKGSWEVVHEKYDIILANLVASTHLRTNRHMPNHLAYNGVAVISGFGGNQVKDIKRFFEEAGLTMSQQFSFKRWSALTMILK
jgi:ribosomal protein L11 methyltransferase